LGFFGLVPAISRTKHRNRSIIATSGIVVPANEWVTVVFDIPDFASSAIPRTGSGALTSSTGKGVFEAIGFIGEPGETYDVYLDNFAIVP
jgi:hypothetical protein